MRNKQTVINAVVKRDTRVEIKQKKRERSEDFLHTNLVPRKKEKKQNVKERESKRA